MAIVAKTSEVTDTRPEKVKRTTSRIHDELRGLSLEDLEDILNGLVLARTYKSAHVPQELP